MYIIDKHIKENYNYVLEVRIQFMKIIVEKSPIYWH